MDLLELSIKKNMNLNKIEKKMIYCMIDLMENKMDSEENILMMENTKNIFFSYVDLMEDNRVMMKNTKD